MQAKAQTAVQSSAFVNLSKYIIRKIFSLVLMVTLSVLLIILIGNFGGYIDEMVRGEIEFSVGLMVRSQYPELSPTERVDIVNQVLESSYEAAGLNEPFINRTMRWLWMAIRLDLGQHITGSAYSPMTEASVTVRQMLLNSLPPTLALFGSANLVIFFASAAIGLVSSQKYRSRLDRFIQKAALLSTIPPWFYGVVLGTFLILNHFWVPTWLLLFLAIFLGKFFPASPHMANLFPALHWRGLC